MVLFNNGESPLLDSTSICGYPDRLQSSSGRGNVKTAGPGQPLSNVRRELDFSQTRCIFGDDQFFVG